MAHFVKIENNIVTQTIVVGNNDCNGGNFPESETFGQSFIENVLKKSGVWLQTSYNANFRNFYAGYGFLYLEDKDIFIPQCQYQSWVIAKNENNKWNWIAPKPTPDNENQWEWDENIIDWVIIN